MTNPGQGRGEDAVWVTGLGLITGLARGGRFEARSLRERILARMPADTVSGAGDVPLGECDFPSLLGARGLRHMSRGTLALLAASRLALEDAGFASEGPGGGREISVTAGTATATAGLVADFDRTTLREGPLSANPALFPQTVWNGPSSQVAIRFGLRGANMTLSTGLNSGLDAVIAATRLLRRGRAQTVLASGFEEITPFFRVLFEREGPGVRLGEGAVVLVLELESSARARGARPLAELYCSRSVYVAGQRADGDCLDALVGEVLRAGATRSAVRTWRSIQALSGTSEAAGAAVDVCAAAGFGGGSSGALAAALAAAGAGDPELVVADDGGGRVAALLVGPTR